MMVFFLVDKNLLQKIIQPIPVGRILPMVGFFLLYLLFYFLSDGDNLAFQSMFSKFTFFVLPILFAYESHFTKTNQKKILAAFSLALSVSFLYTLIYSYTHFYQGIPNASPYHFLNRMTLSAGIMHPGYYSNFFMLAILWHYFSASRYRYFFIAFFTIVLLLMISRIVLLFYILFAFYIMVKYIFKTKKPFLTAVLFAALACLAGIGFYQIGTVKNRVDETIGGLKNQTSEVNLSAATASRSVAYREEIKMVKAKPILGYGLGNANDALQIQLKKSGFHALAKDMHTHNQYFNTWFHTGIFGFFWLCFLLLFLAVYFYNKNNQLAFWFTILVVMNLLTDDMLEIQAGIVFFALIWSLNLFVAQENKDKIILP